MSAATPFLVATAVIASVSIPLILQVVPPNRWYGIRTAKTLSDRALWFRANRFAGWAFLGAAMASAAIFIVAPEVASSYGAVALVMPVGVALFLSLAYIRTSSAGGGGSDGG